MHLLSCLNNISAFDESKEILEKKNLTIIPNFEKGLYLVKYDKLKSDMSDEDVQKCRGLIMSIEDNTLVCVPPFKSLKLNDFSNIAPDTSKIIYEDFLDGTMINIFNWKDEWLISTRSKIGADCRWFSKKTFLELFNDSSEDLDYEKLDKNCCYTFVLQHPDNRIVKSYEKPQITLVGARYLNGYECTDLDLQNVKESLELSINIPKRFKFDDLIQTLDFVNSQKYDFQGLVIKYNGFRSKIRNPAYNYVKKLRGNTNNIKYIYLELRKTHEINNFLEFFPEYKEIFEATKNELHLMTNNLWNCYKRYYISDEKLVLNKKDMPFEFRPLCFELHGIYLSNKANNYKLNWNEIIKYVNNLPSAKQLFVMNYRKYLNN